jgi:hypothetical protein
MWSHPSGQPNSFGALSSAGGTVRIGGTSDFCLKIQADALGKAPYGFDLDSYRFVRGCGIEMVIIWARPSVIWATPEPDFRALDYEIGAAFSCGIEPVIKLAPIGGETTNAPLWNVMALLPQVASRYPGIRYFIVGNEPEYGDWPSKDWQAYVDQVIAPCAAALKAVRPDALLIGPEADSPGILAEILAAEAGRYLDIVSHHAYAWSPNFPADAITRMEGFEEVMTENVSTGSRQRWITECGPGVQCLDGPGSDMVTFLRAAESLGYDAAFTYRLRSETEGRTDITGPNWEHGLTKLGPNWTTVPLERAADPFRAALATPRASAIQR